MSGRPHTISHLLHPPLLDEAGLGSAIRWYVEGFGQRSGIKVKLELPSQFDRLHGDVETALFRALQEGLTNVHRHSGSGGYSPYGGRQASAIGN
jgi:signal transduction histidine kinase